MGFSGIGIDASEVNQLAIDLSRAPQRVQDAAAKVFANEADALQRDMRRDARNHRYLPDRTKSGAQGFALQLNKEKVADLHHVVGFNKKGAGRLANIIVFGSVNNAPVYNFYGPLIRRTPHFVEYLGNACEDAVFRGSE